MNFNNDFLTPIRSSVKRRKFATVDIESKDGNSQKAGFTRPFLVGVYDGSTYEEFRNEPHLKKVPWEDAYWSPGGCVDKALNYMLSDRFRGVQFYAHNGGSFDHLFWLAWLKKHEDEYSFDVVPIQSSIQKIEIRRRDEPVPEGKKKRKGSSWTFLDSMKLFPGSLQKMLTALGLQAKVQHDLELHEEDPTWSHYLSWDCMGLYEAITRMHDLIEKMGGEIGMTAPATAMKLFRRAFLGRGTVPDSIPRHLHWNGCKERFKRRKKDEKKDCDGCCQDFVVRGYYGGRTEVFRSHGEGLRYYDINSSYVSAMRETMPAGERVVERNPKRIDWRRHEDYIGFAEVSVEIPENCEIPPLPHRAPSGKLIFPAGRFHGVWDVDELKLLDDSRVKGRVLKIDRVVWYRRVYLFREMVDVLWELRDTSRPGYDKGLSELAKLMGNSTYGKFGMKKLRTQIVFRHEEAKPEECFLCLKPAVEFFGLCNECEGSKPANGDPECDVWYQQRTVDAPYIIPQISAHITTLGRINLFNFMMRAMDKGGHIYYGDTDSIITDVDMPSSKILGEFKDEYPGKELKGMFIQPKVYMIEESERSHRHRSDEYYTKAWAAQPIPGPTYFDVTEPQRMGPKVTMKGFPREVRTKENLGKLQAGCDVRFDRLEKVRSLARERFVRGPQMVKDKDGVRGVVKSFRGRYDKRHMLPDGTTRSLVLNECDERGEVYDELADAAE